MIAGENQFLQLSSDGYMHAVALCMRARACTHTQCIKTLESYQRSEGSVCHVNWSIRLKTLLSLTKVEIVQVSDILAAKPDD